MTQGVLRASFVIAATLGAGILLHAQGTTPATRFAVIDVQKVLIQSSDGKAAYARLKLMQDERVQRAKQMDEETRVLASEIERQRITLNEKQLADMHKALADKRIAMKRFAENADKEVAAAREREFKVLDDRIRPIIAAAAQEWGIHAVFNKFESGLVYAADAIDITDLILKRLDK